MNKIHSDYLLMKALQHKYVDKVSLQPILEHALDSDDGLNVPVKNLCAKVSETLVNEVDRVSAILDMSKREFVEIAVSNLIQEFYQIAESHDIFNDSDTPKANGDSENQEELPL